MLPEFINHPAAPTHLRKAPKFLGEYNPKCDFFSTQFDASFALQHNLRYPVRKFPIYENVAQYSSLIWNDTATSLGLKLLCDGMPLDKWKKRVSDLHVDYLTIKIKKLEIKRCETQRKTDYLDREMLKVSCLRGRQITRLLQNK